MNIIMLLSLVLVVVSGSIAGAYFLNSRGKKNQNSAEPVPAKLQVSPEEVEKDALVIQAKARAQELIVEAKDTALRLRTQAEDEARKIKEQALDLERKLAIQRGALVETREPTEAQVGMVDFFRSVSSVPIYGPDPKKGLLHIMVGFPQKSFTLKNPFVEAYFWEIDPNANASYPIITVEEAWKAITEDKGVISSVIPKNSNPFLPYSPVRVETILIDNIYLAYYETPKWQQFLQPIYVFEGKYTTEGTEGGYITIYFPAITKDYVKQPSETSPASTQSQE